MTPITLPEALLVAGMMAVTFGVRYPVLALLGRLTLPPLALRALRYVPPAVLTAISVPAVLIPDGQRLAPGIDNAYLAAAIVAVIVSWRTRSLLLTIALGMAAFFLWRLLF